MLAALFFFCGQSLDQYSSFCELAFDLKGDDIRSDLYCYKYSSPTKTIAVVLPTYLDENDLFVNLTL